MNLRAIRGINQKQGTSGALCHRRPSAAFQGLVLYYKGLRGTASGIGTGGPHLQNNSKNSPASSLVLTFRGMIRGREQVTEASGHAPSS